MKNLTSIQTLIILVSILFHFQYTIGQNNKKYNILFVGNSLTYTNDLPKLVEEEAEKIGFKVTTKMLAFPNYALEDHLSDGNVQKLIKKGNFDFVIIQQGPSSQPYGRETLIGFGSYFKKLCIKSNSKLAYFMVWPSKKFYQTFQGVIDNYSEAAEKNNAILCPVGSVWKAHFDATDDFSYYGSDEFHPSLLGSQTAAKVILDSLSIN